MEVSVKRFLFFLLFISVTAFPGSNFYDFDVVGGKILQNNRPPLRSMYGTASPQDQKYHVGILWARTEWLKAKAIMFDETTILRIMMKSPMEDGNYTILQSDPCGYGIPPVKKFEGVSQYITHVSALVNGQTVLDVYTSPNISKHPQLSCRYYNIKDAKEMKFIIYDNNGLRKEAIFPFKKAEVASSVSFRPVHAKKPVPVNTNAFKAMSVPDAIKAVYPHFNHPTEGKISIGVPRISSNSSAIPVTIMSDIDLESLAVFSSETPYPTIAVFANPVVGLINYKFKIKIYNRTTGNYTITAIGKDRNGKFYKTVIKGKYALGSDCCGCV